MSRAQILSVLYIATLLAALEGLAIATHQDGTMLSAVVGGLTFIAGLLLPSPFTKQKGGVP